MSKPETMKPVSRKSIVLLPACVFLLCFLVSSGCIEKMELPSEIYTDETEFSAGDTTYLPLSPIWDDSYGFQTPIEISIAKDGHIFVADPAANSIFVLKQDGSILSEFQDLRNISVDENTISPIDVDVDQKMNIFFIDGSQRVYRWNQIWNDFGIDSIATTVTFVNTTSEIIYEESFETDGHNFRYSASSNGGFYNAINGYFIRTDGLNISIQEGAYSGNDNLYYWAAEDTDDSSGDQNDEQTIVLNSIDLTGYTNIQFFGLFGAGNEGGPGESVYDDNDYIKVFYSVDGGNTYENGLWFCYVNNGDPDDEPIALDTEFDGNGDGTILGSNLQEFNFNIPDASGVIIKIAVNMDEAKEEVAFDDLKIKGTEISVPVAPGSVDCLEMDNSVDWTLYEVEWSSDNEAIDSLLNPHLFFNAGSYTDSIADHYFTTSKFSQFSGISTSGDDNFIYMADEYEYHNRIVRVDFKRSHLIKLGNGIDIWIQKGFFEGSKLNVAGLGTGAGTVNDPVAIDVDNDGNIYYAQLGDFFSIHKIREVTGDYATYPSVYQLGQNEIMELERFDDPLDVAVDKDQFIYVANTGAQEIQVFNSYGNLSNKVGVEDRIIDIPTWESWAVQGTDTLLIDTLFIEGNEFYMIEIKGAFDSPRAVAVDDNGVVYICDTPSSSILRYRLSNQLNEDLNPIP